ncbi:hypothetical protein FGO68_gene4755 [Halteria grandinella]|uniref:Uncharacterized protein n=1 Tax=Halteria grandinella TaxID=5974 RepID=A0A8J8T5H4_HALGN|nr:hypothetical protein FGO68_gene4755 [Halteria grandinella]
MLANDNPRYHIDLFDVKKLLSKRVGKLRKLEVNYSQFENSQHYGRVFPEQKLLQELIQIVDEARDRIDTLNFNISWKIAAPNVISSSSEVMKGILGKLKPGDNKLKKLTLRANQIDEEICALLTNESQFPNLKSLSLICNQIPDDDPCLQFLINVSARSFIKMRFLQCSGFYPQNSVLLEQILCQIPSSIKFLQIDEATLSIDDCMKVLSFKQRPVGFKFQLNYNRHQISDEDVTKLCQMFPKYCILIDTYSEE